MSDSGIDLPPLDLTDEDSRYPSTRIEHLATVRYKVTIGFDIDLPPLDPTSTDEDIPPSRIEQTGIAPLSDI